MVDKSCSPAESLLSNLIPKFKYSNVYKKILLTFEHDDFYYLSKNLVNFRRMILKILLAIPGTVSAKSSAKSTKPK